nr:hypothetical protein [Tanacetum cinerariifolium]
RSDISLPEYEALYDDYVKEISGGSTTNHSDSSLYDSFVFDLSINPFPPTDRSDFNEFADELIHIYLHQSMIVSSSRLNPTRGISPYMPDVSHRCGTFQRSVLIETSMEILSSTCSPMDQ